MGKGDTWRETMIKKYGSEEAVKAEMKRRAAKGGAKGRTGGFYGKPELARLAGKRSGEKRKNDK